MLHGEIGKLTQFEPFTTGFYGAEDRRFRILPELLVEVKRAALQAELFPLWVLS